MLRVLLIADCRLPNADFQLAIVDCEMPTSSIGNRQLAIGNAFTGFVEWREGF
jgi:hypothetical protein